MVKPSHATVPLNRKYSMHNENLSCILFWYSLMTSWPVQSSRLVVTTPPTFITYVYVFLSVANSNEEGGWGDEAEPFLATKKNMSKRPDSLI